MSTLIDINDDHELYIWSRMLRITPDELVRRLRLSLSGRTQTG